MGEHLQAVNAVVYPFTLGTLFGVLYAAHHLSGILNVLSSLSLWVKITLPAFVFGVVGLMWRKRQRWYYG